MGYRTVVVLSNDEAHYWENDPELGKKIGHAASGAWPNTTFPGDPNFGYGSVVEVVHADCQNLVVIDGYEVHHLVQSGWSGNKSKEQVQLELLREAADNLGYKLIKKSVKKNGSV